MAFSDYLVRRGSRALHEVDQSTREPQLAQAQTLQAILTRNEKCELGKTFGFAEIRSVQEYQDKVPIQTFEDYAPRIDRMLENGEKNIITSDRIVRWCSSSGSVGKPKLQPKTAIDIRNMQRAGFDATPACVARFLEAHGGGKLPPQMGPTLISLNGHKLVNGMMSNGAGQIPFIRLKPFLRYFTTTPTDILFPEDEEHTDISYFQLRFCLVNPNVSYLCSLVITLLTNMFEYLEKNWEMLCRDIETGTIDASVRCPESLRRKYGHMRPDPARAAFLREQFSMGFDTPVPIALRIWPRLTWGFGMISSTLAVYAEKLKKYVGDLPMHNMGYAASEGFMAMPVELNARDYVLLPGNLFFEFIPADAEEGARPLLLHELVVGRNYEILLTNFSGLYRYRIMDMVHVTGMFNETPRVEFLYRTNMGVNLANEKTTTQMLDFVAAELEKQFSVDFCGYSFYGDTDPAVPCYRMLAECDSDVLTHRRDEFEAALDTLLRQVNEKYDKYRRWGMLAPAEAHALQSGTYDAYKASILAEGRVLNQIKPVVILNTPERKEFFLSKMQ